MTLHSWYSPSCFHPGHGILSEIFNGILNLISGHCVLLAWSLLIDTNPAEVIWHLIRILSCKSLSAPINKKKKGIWIQNLVYQIHHLISRKKNSLFTNVVFVESLCEHSAGFRSIPLVNVNYMHKWKLVDLGPQYGDGIGKSILQVSQNYLELITKFLKKAEVFAVSAVLSQMPFL